MNSTTVIYLAISSDYKSLYKADVYKTLVKPKGAIEHFRYRKQWLDESIALENIDNIIGNDVVLIYKHTKANPNIYIPIRKATIQSCFYDIETELYHFYFLLGDFCDFDVKFRYKDQVFFYRSSDLNINIVTWKYKIEQVKEYFPEYFFYYIDGIYDSNNRRLILKQDRFNHSYFYEFFHGSNHTLKLRVANPKSSKYTLSIKSSSSDVNIILNENYHVSNETYDILNIPILSKSLDIYKEISFISFFIFDENMIALKEYENYIHIRKKMKISNAFYFALCTTILIAFTWLLKDRTIELHNFLSFNWEGSIDFGTFIYIVGIFITSTLLFYRFNKK